MSDRLRERERERRLTGRRGSSANIQVQNLQVIGNVLMDMTVKDVNMNRP